ncbi:TPA: glycosyltransferase, partial [Escherichia coli]
RSLDYIECLEQENIRVTVSTLFDNEYLENLYRKKKVSFISIFKYYIKRLVFVLFRVKKYDVVFIEKELFPYLPGIFEKLINISRVPYIVDYDDAIFHNYDMQQSWFKKMMLSGKLKPLLSRAAYVTVGNRYLEELSRENGAKNVKIIPTVININRYHNQPTVLFDEIKIGWIGSPSTTKYLKIIWPVLEKLSSKKHIKLITIGADKINDCPIPLEQYPWTLDTECEILNDISFGVMPLEDGLWERGKCGYKLIQYMASCKPVIASNVGVNTEIVTPKVGFLASDETEWLDAFNKFIDNPELISLMGVNARRRVEEHYTLQINSNILIGLLKDVVEGRQI